MKLKALYADRHRVGKGEILEFVSFEPDDEIRVIRENGEEVVIAAQAAEILQESNQAADADNE